VNILALNYEYPPLGGGGGVLSEHVLEHLAAAGHSTTLITSGGQNLDSIEQRRGVRIERVPVVMRNAKNTASMVSMLSYHPLACRAGMAAAAREKFDCMLTFFAIPTGPAGAHIARKAGIPNVLFLLGGDLRRIQRRARQRAEVFFPERETGRGGPPEHRPVRSPTSHSQRTGA